MINGINKKRFSTNITSVKVRSLDKILNSWKIPANCSGVRVPILNQAVAIFHKRADKRLLDIEKGLVFATSIVLETADELILAQNENRPPNPSKVMDHINYGSITLIGKTHKQTLAELKETFKAFLKLKY